MPKRNVSYIKPQEPAFLARLKQQAGYKEGPSVDTKREELPTLNSSDESDGEDQPQVVVLKAGDLTQEEADLEIKRAEEARADLGKRVVFQKPEKPTTAVPSSGKGGKPKGKKRPSEEDSSKRRKKTNLLSFDDQDGEDE